MQFFISDPAPYLQNKKSDIKSLLVGQSGRVNAAKPYSRSEAKLRTDPAPYLLAQCISEVH